MRGRVKVTKAPSTKFRQDLDCRVTHYIVGFINKGMFVPLLNNCIFWKSSESINHAFSYH